MALPVMCKIIYDLNCMKFDNLWCLTLFNLAIITLVAIGYFSDHSLYSTFLGNTSPLLVYILLIVIFIISINLLHSKDWFFISLNFSIKSLIFYFLLSMVIGCLPILIDLWKPFDPEINILFPLSLVYYPSIGFLAEVIFHVLPILALSYLLGNYKFGNEIIIIFVALVEPIFQVLMGMQGDSISSRDILVGIEVFFFSLFQLVIFKKYGFLAMYFMRLGFYITWHLIWGYLRLTIF